MIGRRVQVFLLHGSSQVGFDCVFSSLKLVAKPSSSVSAMTGVVATEVPPPFSCVSSQAVFVRAVRLRVELILHAGACSTTACADSRRLKEKSMLLRRYVFVCMMGDAGWEGVAEGRIACVDDAMPQRQGRRLFLFRGM